MAHVGQKFTLGTAARFGCFLGFSQGLLNQFALGNVQESYDRAHNFSFLADWISPEFDRKAGAVGAPKDFVVRVNAFAISKGTGNIAIFFRIRRPVGVGMVNDAVQHLPNKILWPLMTEQPESSGIAERALSVPIDSINRFRRRIQYETESFFAFSQRFLGTLAIAHFLFQFKRAFLHSPFEIVARGDQIGVTH